MKKWFALFGLLLGLSSMVYAGTPQENFYVGQAPLSNTSLWTSTASTNASSNLTLAVAPAAGAGATASQCRVCATKFIIQIPTTTVVSILDGGTTNYTIFGVGLGTSSVSTLVLPEDHLGPLCASTGNTMNINLVNTAGLSTTPQAFNFEGYTTCGGTANKGPMQ